jgi:hypothetical protein
MSKLDLAAHQRRLEVDAVEVEVDLSVSVVASLVGSKNGAALLNQSETTAAT